MYFACICEYYYIMSFIIFCFLFAYFFCPIISNCYSRGSIWPWLFLVYAIIHRFSTTVEKLFASEGLLSVPQKVSSWMAGLVGLRVDNCAG